MKEPNGDKDLLDQIDRTLEGIILSEPLLGIHALDLTAEERREEVIRLFRRLDCGLPLQIPESFRSTTDALTQRSDWNKLMFLLQEWGASEESSTPKRLKSRELKRLGLGLLWGSLLINALDA